MMHIPELAAKAMVTGGQVVEMAMLLGVQVQLTGAMPALVEKAREGMVPVVQAMVVEVGTVLETKEAVVVEAAAKAAVASAAAVMAPVVAMAVAAAGMAG